MNTEGGHDLNEATLTGGLSWVFDGPVKDVVSGERKGEMSEAAAILHREGRVGIDLKVEFDFDKSVIKPQYEQSLRDFAAFMEEQAGTTAEIEGHTDSVGSKAYNDRLSMRRANAIREWLVTKGGIAPGRLTARGYGFSQPIADNSTAEGRARNRRVIGTVRK